MKSFLLFTLVMLIFCTSAKADKAEELLRTLRSVEVYSGAEKYQDLFLQAIESPGISIEMTDKVVYVGTTGPFGFLIETYKSGILYRPDLYAIVYLEKTEQRLSNGHDIFLRLFVIMLSLVGSIRLGVYLDKHEPFSEARNVVFLIMLYILAFISLSYIGVFLYKHPFPSLIASTVTTLISMLLVIDKILSLGRMKFIAFCAIVPIELIVLYVSFYYLSNQILSN